MAKLLIPVENIEAYIEAIKADYKKFRFSAAMEKSFNDGVHYEVLNKYVKVITGGSVHSFIVNTENDKFPLGTILKAAGWKAPAKNFSRGSIYNLPKRIPWTGW